MKIELYLVLLFSLLLSSCKNEQSLQKYFVENAENKNFLTLDVSPSIIDIDKSKLTIEQKTALESFDKMNILAFKLDKNNKAQYDVESQKVTQLLKNEKYQELMKVGSGKDAASVSFIGDENHIDEFPTMNLDGMISTAIFVYLLYKWILLGVHRYQKGVNLLLRLALLQSMGHLKLFLS